MTTLQAVWAFHVNAFTFLVYLVETHYLLIVAALAIGYLFWQDLKDNDVKFVYDQRKML